MAKSTKKQKEVEVKETTIDASVNKPTQEDVDRFKLDFETTATEFGKKQFEIGNEEKALTYIEFLESYIEDYNWKKTEWMGIIRLSEELKIAKQVVDTKKSFAIGYQALEFTYYILDNPSGKGVSGAKYFEGLMQTYSEIYEKCGEQLKGAREELKEIQHKQDVYAAAIQGFFLVKDEVEEESVITDNGNKVAEDVK